MDSAQCARVPAPGVAGAVAEGCQWLALAWPCEGTGTGLAAADHQAAPPRASGSLGGGRGGDGYRGSRH
jgi:hypothetical protein